MRAVSIYVHVPFCKRRCPYCTFYHVPQIEEREDAFVDALLSEFGRAVEEIGEAFRAPTVFFGGGTPSALRAASFDRIINVLAPYLSSVHEPEITVEVNPEDVTAQRTADLRRLGVNRVSLGVQSMSARALRTLKRCAPDVNRGALELVRRRFDNVSVDLLLGVPGSSLRELEETTTEVCAARPRHVSVYCLEAGGDMDSGVREFLGRVDVESAADQYLAACRMLGEHGFTHYEVSNFALPGYESRHNRVYWDGGEYLGIGPGAHSCVNGQRFHNEPSIEPYLRGARQLETRRVDVRREVDRELESLMLDLRTSRGLAVDRISCPPEVPAELATQGLARRRGGRLVLTDRGYLVLNDILFRLTRAA
ncbi:MAG: radical SAM family heme chaperone HemW [Candidatus Krumholzibacteriia bacterium]